MNQPRSVIMYKALKLLVASLLCAPPLLNAESENPAAGAPTATQSLADAETSFAQMAREKGTREAFLTYLTDDAVIFEPGPVNGKKVWEKKAPASSVLTWQPNFVAVSRGGDLGYSTGPWEFKKEAGDPEPKAYGQFFSIWKKQNDGAWKVVLDAGIDTPKPVGKPSVSEVPAPKTGADLKLDLAAARERLGRTQQAFTEASNKDTGVAVATWASDDIRVLRSGVFPAIGRAGARLMLSSDHAKTIFKRSGGDISQSADLAYEYGEYFTDRLDGPDRGGYVLVWKTDDRGRWRLAVDQRKRQPIAEIKPSG